MSNARKCDRCGAFYTDNKFKSINGEYVTRIGLLVEHDVVKKLDFCDECFEEFDKFMDKPNAIAAENTETPIESKGGCIDCKYGPYGPFKYDINPCVNYNDGDMWEAKEMTNAMDIVNEYIKNHYGVKSESGLIASHTTPKIKCNDGFEISVQASEYAYCQPKQNSAWPYKMVELGYPSKKR